MADLTLSLDESLDVADAIDPGGIKDILLLFDVLSRGTLTLALSDSTTCSESYTERNISGFSLEDSVSLEASSFFKYHLQLIEQLVLQETQLTAHVKYLSLEDTIIFDSSTTNDDFAHAQVLYGTSGVVLGDNRIATVETGEPEHVGWPRTNSIWYKWTASADGFLMVDLLDSEVADTVVAVYTGTRVDALTLVGSNDDFDAFTFRSRVIVPVMSGITYYVAVAGYMDTNRGDFTVSWSFTEGPQEFTRDQSQVTDSADISII